MSGRLLIELYFKRGIHFRQILYPDRYVVVNTTVFRDAIGDSAISITFLPCLSRALAGVNARFTLFPNLRPIEKTCTTCANRGLGFPVGFESSYSGEASKRFIITFTLLALLVNFFSETLSKYVRYGLYPCA